MEEKEKNEIKTAIDNLTRQITLSTLCIILGLAGIVLAILTIPF